MNKASDPNCLTVTQRKPKRKRTPEEQRAEVERVAREHGADLSEEKFNEALRRVLPRR